MKLGVDIAKDTAGRSELQGGSCGYNLPDDIISVLRRSNDIPEARSRGSYLESITTR